MKMKESDVIYSMGSISDLDEIIDLHTRSWQEHYRGILSDEYLDETIITERRDVWESRFEILNPNQIIITAKVENSMCGFACHFLHYHEEYGHYLDNLHVNSSYQGLGIGRKLIQLSKRHCQQFDDKPYYLWVFSKNEKAIQFYDRMGGIAITEEEFSCPDGGKANALLYQWKR